MTNDPIAIARAVYAAYIQKDRPAIEALISKDFHFTSPLDNRLDRKTYFERCWPNSEKIRDFEFIHMVPMIDQVFVTYVGTNADGHRFRNTELLTIHDDQLVDTEVYFGWSVPHEARSGSFVSGT